MATKDNYPSPTHSTDQHKAEVVIDNNNNPFDDTMESVTSTLSSSAASFVLSLQEMKVDPMTTTITTNTDIPSNPSINLDKLKTQPVAMEDTRMDISTSRTSDNENIPILGTVAEATMDPTKFLSTSFSLSSSFSAVADLSSVHNNPVTADSTSVGDTMDDVHHARILPVSTSASSLQRSLDEISTTTNGTTTVSLPELVHPSLSSTTNTINSIDPSPLPSSSPSSSSYVVRMRNVHKTYLLGLEGVAALRGVTLDIESHEFIVILGKSGGGKTTMLNILGTIDKPTRGDLSLCGHIINDKTPDQLLANVRLNDIGFVFQTFNLLPGLTALENVELPMILSGKFKTVGERRKRAIHLLSRVGMYERLHHYPSEMSGGEQQRVTIARALANNPRILLLDEPTGDLDTVNTDIILRIITDLNRNENVTCILVTHDINLKNYAHRVIHMLDGKINRIENIPSFIRDDALDLLNCKVSVQSWLKIQEQERIKGTTSISSPTIVGFSETSSYIAMAYQGLFQVQQGIGSMWSGMLAQLQGYTIHDSTVSGSQTNDNLGSPSSLSSPTHQGSVTRDNPVIVVVPPDNSIGSTTRNTESSTTVHTSTGLSGVAAISHSLYSAHATTGTQNKVLQPNGSTDSNSQANTPSIATVTRSPQNYVTYNYSIKAKEQAFIEAQEQKLREQRKEEKLRKKIYETARQRHQQQYQNQ